jgi:hypothetical protein
MPQTTKLYYIINEQHNYYIANEAFLKRCHKQQNVAVTVLPPLPVVYKSKQQNALPNAMYWPSHRQTGTTTINIQSTLRTAPICVKSFTAILFGSNGNSCTVCTVSGMSIYTHILHNIETLVRDSNECRVPRKTFHAPFLALVSQVC